MSKISSRLNIAASLLLATLALAGCAKQSAPMSMAAAPAASARAVAEQAADATVMRSPEGAFLAYEHTVRLTLPGADIAPRLKAVAAACQSAQFGDCAVLQMSQSGGSAASGFIELRIAPQGVEPVIALASDKGDVSQRSSSAEDLAQQVAETQLRQARLKNEHARLMEYQQRKDMTVADLLTVSQRLSEIEAGLEQADREAAQQRRRIDTQKVSIYLESTSSQRNRSELAQALSGVGDVFTASLSYLILFLAGALPWLLVGAVALWGVVKLWRWRRNRRQREAARQG